MRLLSKIPVTALSNADMSLSNGKYPPNPFAACFLCALHQKAVHKCFAGHISISNISKDVISSLKKILSKSAAKSTRTI